VKLNLMFVAMYLLTLLAYPIVYVYGKLHPLVDIPKGIPRANPLLTSSVTPGR